MTNTFNFETREQYIAWRAEWKSAYETTSIAIRAAKKAIKTANRDNDWIALSRAHWSLISLKKQANKQLAERADSKMAAAAAREQRLHQEAVVA